VHSVVTGTGFLISIPLFPVMGAWAFALWAVIPSILGRILVTTGFVDRS
jgi:hypothetical protein